MTFDREDIAIMLTSAGLGGEEVSNCDEDERWSYTRVEDVDSVAYGRVTISLANGQVFLVTVREAHDMHADNDIGPPLRDAAHAWPVGINSCCVAA